MTTASATLLEVEPDPVPRRRWFSERGCVEHHDDRMDVFVGGSLVATFTAKERGARNVILVGLSSDPRAHFGRIAQAFEVSQSTLRLIRRQHEAEGLAAVVNRVPTGRPRKLTGARLRRAEKMFAQGVRAAEVHRRLSKRMQLSKSTVFEAHRRWRERERAGESAQPRDDSAPVATQPTQGELVAAEAEAVVPSKRAVLPKTSGEAERQGTDEPAMASHESSAGPWEQATSEPQALARVAAAEEAEGAEAEITAAPLRSERFVQHVGAWLMVAMVHGLGLYEAAEQKRGRRVRDTTLRIALDAVVIALSIGQRCVEGVRRLGTSSASVLLRAGCAPSATWVRRILGRFAQEAGGAWLQLRMAGHYLREALARSEERAVFYVDNHLRVYTGKHEVRRGWRMQDKRSRPGITDYWVHDEDGRPVLRRTVPSHDHLTHHLTPIGELLRLGLGPSVKILLAFDRAGSFPEQMAGLRDEGFEFVTYERRPFERLPEKAFEHTMVRGDETLRWHESRRRNLRNGRGRVRRICVLTGDGRQINLLAISELPAQDLVDVMRGRWLQENGFKHGNERWGINQLDSRTTEPYPPETIIPNPARRRLDRALRIARVREGDARRHLARLSEEHPRHTFFERELAEALAQQAELEAQRPHVPTHAPLEETELADKLVHHIPDYKHVIDTIRIACANAESELAAVLAPSLKRPREAKRVLQNLFNAPGEVRVNKRIITVTLQPAGNTDERRALQNLLEEVSRRGLTLPGDAKRRVLRFRLGGS